jgi:acyl-CoA thioesterase FadM
MKKALWQLFHHLGLTPTALRGDIRMAGVQQSISYRESNEVCASCELTAVCIDASTRKPRPLPQEVKTRAAQLLQGTPP